MLKNKIKFLGAVQEISRQIHSSGSTKLLLCMVQKKNWLYFAHNALSINSDQIKL